MLGKYTRVKVAKAVGTEDATYGFTYPVNFGYTLSGQAHTPANMGTFILGINHPVREFDGRVIGVLTKKKGNEKMLVVAPKSKRYINHEIDAQIGFLREYFDYTMDCYYERSCGAVVYFNRDGKVRFLLIKNKRSAHWSFPKGHIEKGETDEETAIREVLEETGVNIEILPGFKVKSEYSIQGKIEKMVYIFLASTESTATEIQQEEIEDYRWLEYENAMKNLRFENDRSILWKAHEHLKKHKYIQ